MAAASFLAFASALNGGAHIRVSILLNSVPAGARRMLEIWCFGISTAIVGYFVYYAYWFVFWSWKFNEVSQAQDATPLWIPQSVMVVGGGILFIAFLDNFIAVLMKGEHRLGSSVVDQSFGE
jgi:TRAP-type C4-dicarboxylate transport system permease small subunit